MRRIIPDSRSAVTSRPHASHLSLAPEPTAAPKRREKTAGILRLLHPIRTGKARAYRAGRLDALASVVDVSRRALANLDRLEAMDVEELDEIAALAGSAAYAKRHNRPSLRLVDDIAPAADAATGETRPEGYGVAYLALAAVQSAAVSPDLHAGIRGDYEAMGRPELAASFTAAVEASFTGDAS